LCFTFFQPSSVPYFAIDFFTKQNSTYQGGVHASGRARRRVAAGGRAEQPASPQMIVTPLFIVGDKIGKRALPP
jgi:hypothetical protein